jgi:exodeoxyribonuclease V alpha subunit
MQVIEGKVHRVISHKPSPWDRAGGRYLIARLHTGQIVKGPMEGCAPDLPYRFFGELRAGKNGYAEAFHFQSYAVLCDPGRRGIEQYLRGHVPGIGHVYARRIYETFGDDALAVLRVDPNRLTECSVPEHLIERATKHFADPHVIDPEAHAYLIDLLSPFKVPSMVVNKLIEAFKSDAPARLRERPYMLMQFPRVGWVTADQVALNACGYDPEGLERHAIAIEEALWAISLEGHTWAPEVEVEQVAYRLLSRRPREDAWQAAEEAGEVVCHGGFNPSWSLESLARAEQTIAGRLQRLLEAGRPLKFSIGGEELSPHQGEAVRGFAEHSVFALIGPPGVGKTWTTCAVVRSLYGMGIRNVLLVAPTGAAAKRSHAQFREHETYPPPCLTIHRALGIAPSVEPAGIPSDLARHGRGRDPFGFYHSDELPLDCSVLIVEEASMCDAPLLASLLRAVRPGTRVLLVGDPDQLPPVGPGFPLRDLLDAGIPQARLTEVHRNCGRIVHACHAIREGHAPEAAHDVDLEAGDNWVHLEIDDPAQIATEIVGLVTGCKTFDRLWDIQVISPQKRTAHIGTYDLNALLSWALNPDHAKQADDGPDPEFYVGDKIVRTANGLVDEMVLLGQVDPDPSWGDVAHLPDGRWEVIWQDRHFAVRETPVVNGDVGLVLDMVPTERRGMDVIVLFRDPDRLCTLPLGDCHLIRAWCITTHKAQGRGIPYVILPVHRSFYWDAKRGTGLACRENLYTRFSRASKLLVTVGQYAAIEAEVRRPTVARRRTRLKSLIQLEPDGVPR